MEEAAMEVEPTEKDLEAARMRSRNFSESAITRTERYEQENNSVFWASMGNPEPGLPLCKI